MHTAYYQLEPLAERGCEVNALNRRAGTDQYDEVWDYSRSQVQLCQYNPNLNPDPNPDPNPNPNPDPTLR